MRCGFTIPVEAEHPQGRERVGKLEEGFHLDMRSRLHREVVVFDWARPGSSESVLACYAVQTKCGDRVSGFPIKGGKRVRFWIAGRK